MQLALDIDLTVTHFNMSMTAVNVVRTSSNLPGYLISCDYWVSLWAVTD